MSDDVIFHGMLYSSAVSAGLFAGQMESQDIANQMEKTIGLVNRRLGEGRGVSDVVIGAVTCLAIGEVIHPTESMHFSEKVRTLLMCVISNDRACVETM